VGVDSWNYNQFLLHLRNYSCFLMGM